MEKGINTEKDFEIAKKIAHVLSGDCSEENRSSLDEWLSESEGNRNLYERILDERNREAFQKNAAKFDRSVGWEKSLQKRRQRTTGRQIQTHRRVLRWVAVVTLVCGVGVAAMLYWEQKTEVGSMVAQNEVVQGGTRAILTLADGKVVDLEQTKGGIVEKQSATNIFNQGRSEEHTSELQSRQYLVCRLLLEKKNFFNDTATTEIYTLSLHDALPI